MQTKRYGPFAFVRRRRLLLGNGIFKLVCAFVSLRTMLRSICSALYILSSRIQICIISVHRRHGSWAACGGRWLNRNPRACFARSVKRALYIKHSDDRIALSVPLNTRHIIENNAERTSWALSHYRTKPHLLHTLDDAKQRAICMDNEHKHTEYLWIVAWRRRTLKDS